MSKLYSHGPALLPGKDIRATVVGLPTGFRLEENLRKAASIRLATAFAHNSGWELLEDAINQVEGRVYLLTGLDFNRTEPDLLRSWQKLTLKSDGPKVRARTYRK